MLCLANLDGTIYAVGNRCPHERWPLANGTLDGEEIVCPGHGMLVNVRNCTINAMQVEPGAILGFEVKVEDGGVWVGGKK